MTDITILCISRIEPVAEGFLDHMRALAARLNAPFLLAADPTALQTVIDQLGASKDALAKAIVENAMPST